MHASVGNLKRPSKYLAVQIVLFASLTSVYLERVSERGTIAL